MSDESDRKPEDVKNILMDFGSPWDAIVPSQEANDLFISGLGIVFNHYIAIPDVLGQKLIGDLRSEFGYGSADRFGLDSRFDFRENGFLYKFAGQVWGIFQGNNKSFKEFQAGLYSSSGATITFNRYYRGSTKYVSFAEYDKIIPCVDPKQFYSVNWERVKANMAGFNRLQFNASEIEMIVDSDGVIYEERRDYILENGGIRWLSGNGAQNPGIDHLIGTSKLLGVRYKYKPTFYIQYMGHDIRICPTFDPETGGIVDPLSTDKDGNITYRPGPVTANVVADIVFLDRRTTEDAQDAQINTEQDGDNLGPR